MGSGERKGGTEKEAEDRVVWAVMVYAEKQNSVLMVALLPQGR